MMVDVHINIVVNNNNSQSGDSHMSTMQRLNLTSPLRIVINGSSRMAILLLLSLLYTNPTSKFIVLKNYLRTC
ncbi:hypothetical protein NC653_022932 [Populus alba x Populus x berolinensis]|uniref:Uncharacterized protein n=1 Tax=Populus alba x Populus x berolinensis TaxID=444605 RepID=A0AAD6MFV8_9ROSI|nr:hypothetical protein NC653_022932 [Populus alba x Populus x berolinensis]